MNLHNCFFCIALIICTTLQAQDRPKNVTPFASVHFIPNSFVVVPQVGVQCRLGSRWGITADVAFLSFRHNDIDMQIKRYIKPGLEVKWYNKIRISYNNYLSLQTAYAIRSLHFKEPGYFYDPLLPDTSMYRYQSAKAESPQLTVLLKMGREISFKKHLLLDLFMGIGMRNTFTNYTSKTGLQIAAFSGRQEVFDPIPAYRFNTTMTRIIPTVGFRAGWRFY